MACAQSSITLRLCLRAISMIGSISQGLPAKCTGRMARVRCEMAASIAAGSMFCVATSTSASTGVKPAWMIALTEAQNVIGVVMTSEPGSNPSATMLTCSAAVQEFTAATCDGCKPWYAAKSRSNCATRGPVPSHADSMHATTSSISACSISGEPKIRKGCSGADLLITKSACSQVVDRTLRRNLALFRQPLKYCDLSVEPTGEVHASQGVDLFQRLFGLAITRIQRGQIDPVRRFAWVAGDRTRKVNLRLRVVVQDVALEVGVGSVQTCNRVRARQRGLVGALQLRHVELADAGAVAVGQRDQRGDVFLARRLVAQLVDHRVPVIGVITLLVMIGDHDHGLV